MLFLNKSKYNFIIIMTIILRFTTLADQIFNNFYRMLTWFKNCKNRLIDWKADRIYSRFLSNLNEMRQTWWASEAFAIMFSELFCVVFPSHFYGLMQTGEGTVVVFFSCSPSALFFFVQFYLQEIQKNSSAVRNFRVSQKSTQEVLPNIWTKKK